jgi:hypothetical protein
VKHHPYHCHHPLHSNSASDDTSDCTPGAEVQPSPNESRDAKLPASLRAKVEEL